MNSVNLIGRITKNLKLQASAKGDPIVAFTVAVNEGSAVHFVPCITFGKLAGNVELYCGKGSLVGVIDKIQAIADKQTKTNKIFVLAKQVQFLDHKDAEVEAK